MTHHRALPGFILAATLAFPVVSGPPASAQQSATDLLIQGRSMEQPQPSARKIALPAGNPLEVLHVYGNVYMIAGGPSNVAVQIGDEGVLLVDSATAEVSDHVLQAVRVLSQLPIHYIINTTSDRSHYGGNQKIGEAGQNPTIAPRGLAGPGSIADDGQGGGNNPAQLRPQGAIVFSHENVLNRMSAPTGATPAEPFPLWPSNTFFTARKTMWFNDEPIEMRHVASAHTDGDILVFFRRSDVVAAGDIIRTTQYPVFDPKRGGSIQGILNGLNEIIEIAVPRFNQQAGTRVVPGHGRILNEADVVEYRDMMTIIRDRIKSYVDKGQTLEQIRKMGPTLEYDPLYSVPEWTGEMLIEAVYNDLRQPRATATASR